MTTPSVHFYKSFQTTENGLLCMLSETSSTPYNSEQREYICSTIKKKSTTWTNRAPDLQLLENR